MKSRDFHLLKKWQPILSQVCFPPPPYLIANQQPCSVPTKEMFAYAMQASLGDDVYNEPSTISLEAHIAKLTGKEAALFVSSGTMGNQLAIRSHLQQPPNSIICDVRGHINKFRLLIFS